MLNKIIPYLHIQSPQSPQAKACMRRGFLPTKSEQGKLWLRLWETARKQIKGSAICKQLQLRPPAKPSGSESRAAAQQPLPVHEAVSPPCAAPPRPKTMQFTCGGVISAKLADAVCTDSASPQAGRGARAALLQLLSHIRPNDCQILPEGLLLGLLR